VKQQKNMYDQSVTIITQTEQLEQGAVVTLVGVTLVHKKAI